jgi:predicted AlkP superfamily phosphohydrolase/phosphomutase
MDRERPDRTTPPRHHRCVYAESARGGLCQGHDSTEWRSDSAIARRSFTGALPARTGIVASSFVDAGDSLGTQARPFSTPFRVEALWSAIQRQGLRVTCVYVPHADATSPERACTHTLPFPSTAYSGGVHSLVADHEVRSSYYENVMALRPLDLPAKPGVRSPKYAYAIDTLRDGRRNYQAVILTDQPLDATDRGPGFITSKYARVKTSQSGDSLTVALRSIDSYSGSASVYVGPIVGLSANADPRDSAFARTNPAGAETGAMLEGMIDESIWIEQARLSSRHTDAAVRRQLVQADWDLLITYISLADDIEHRFLTVDPRQADYAVLTNAQRQSNTRRIEETYRTIDSMISGWMRLAPDADFVVVSDHGMVPAHTVILLNNAMANAGVRLRQEALAYTDGASARIYIAGEGSHPGAHLTPGESDAVRLKLEQLIGNLRDPLTHRSPIRLIATDDEIERLGLAAHGRGGDIYVSAEPGYGFSVSSDTSLPVFLQSAMSSEGRRLAAGGNLHIEEFLRHGSLNRTSPGLHSYMADVERNRPFFFAVGPDVPRQSRLTVRSIDVAATVAALLGVGAPSGSEGKPVLRPCKDEVKPTRERTVRRTGSARDETFLEQRGCKFLE